MKTALITGASAGIGLELSKVFVRNGHSVLLIARRQDRLLEIANELKLLNPQIKVSILSIDLSEPDAAKKVYDFTVNQKIQIDFLVNNAGFGSNGTFSDLKLSNELNMIDLNIKALVALTHTFLPSMIKNKSGRILNVGSMAGFQPGPYMTTYYATKAFVNSFSEALSHELQNTGLTCTVLAPGPTATEFSTVANISSNQLFNATKPALASDVALAGYKAMMAGHAMCVPGLRNNILVQSLRVSPRSLATKIAARLNQM